MPATSAIASSPALDLSALPAPDVVQQISYEAILAALIADMQARWPEFDALVESEPLVKLLELVAYRELILRQHFNDRARSVMLAFAGGADLEHLAALFGLTRLVIAPANPVTGAAAVLESDDDLRRRVLLAPDSWSVAGPEAAYIFHALSAHPEVLDASATSPQPDDIKALVLDVLTANAAAAPLVAAMTAALDAAVWPGTVTVAVLARTNPGTAPAPVITAVEAVVNADGIRPLTDHVIVQSATVIEFPIVATLKLFAGPDATAIVAAARASLESYLASAHRLGREIPLSAITAALHVGGVRKVVINAPLADVECTAQQATFCTGITLTVTQPTA